MHFMRGLLMKFETSSSHLLSVTKSKAKMYEFDLPEEHHIQLREAPSELLLMTIGMLGDLCRAQSTSELPQAEIQHQRVNLRDVAKYFDALVNSKLESDYDYYLTLLGASAYYLSDMPGSSIVLAKSLNEKITQLTSLHLEQLLHWLLVGDINTPVIITEDSPINHLLEKIAADFKDFFKLIPTEENLLAAVTELQRFSHNNGTDRELLLSDIIAAVVQRKIENSTIRLLPTYSALKLKDWQNALLKPSFVTEFWPAQKLLGESGIFKGTSSVIQLPTSAGKTKSSEIIIRSAFLSGRTQVAVIIAPFRSLCREISETLSTSFEGEEVLINQLNDVPQIDGFDINLFDQIFTIEEVEETTPSIVVSTPEKFVYLLRHKPELAEEISLVIYDEGHQFDTGSRGVTYELLLTTLKQKLPPKTQHVLISAVMPNANSIGEWLYAGEGEVVNGSECLATERSIAFSSWRTSLGQFHYVDPSNTNIEEFFVPRLLESLPIPLKGRERKQRYFPEKEEKTSVAAYLALKLSKIGPVAVFCGTKSSVNKILKLAIAATNRLEELPIPANYSKQEEITKIFNLSTLHLGHDAVVTKAIDLGILPHSSNIPNGLRISVEYAMELGLGRCVVCTSTLAQGVNLPIKYLVVSGVFQGRNRISTRDFHNLLGRAGRSGKHTEGSVIFTDTELYDKRLGPLSWQWQQMSNLLDPSKSENCSSSLLLLVQPFIDSPYPIDPINFIQEPLKYIDLVKKAAANIGGDITSLLSQMSSRIGYIKSLESYLLSNSQEDIPLAGEELSKLCKSTLAYSIANDDEKAQLIRAFNIVATNVNQIEPKLRVVFGRALLGIEELNIIKGWLTENIEALELQPSIFSTLAIIWPILKKLLPDSAMLKLTFNDSSRLKFRDNDSALALANWWCSGKSYSWICRVCKKLEIQYIAGSQKREMSIEKVVEICDNSFGYDCMLIVGAIADLTEQLFGIEELSQNLRFLQSSLKLGLDSELAVWLYSQGLADRVVARDVASRITTVTDEPVYLNQQLLQRARKEIEDTLSIYPSIFMNSLYKGL